MRIETATIQRLRDALLQSGRKAPEVVTSAYAALTEAGLLGPTEASALARLDPMIETMFLMMAADGQLHDDEKTAIIGAVRELSGGEVPDGVVESMLKKYATLLHEDGREARLMRVATALSSNRDDAEGAFALAAAVALADTGVSDAERKLVGDLAHWFGIAPERTAELLDQLRNDGTLAS
jgi:tellurite resistance protein